MVTVTLTIFIPKYCIKRMWLVLCWFWQEKKI